MDWQQAFKKHRELLEEHLGIWRMVERDAQPGSAIRSTAEKCLHQTQSMIQACASVNTNEAQAEAGDQMRHSAVNRDRRNSPEEPQNQPGTKAKRARTNPAEGLDPTTTAHVPSVTDQSGLFSIDPNPTPINALLDDFNKTTTHKKDKRRRSEQGISQPLSNEVGVDGGSGPVTKHVKKQHEETVQPTAEEIEEYNQSFEAKVELRLKQKEQDRQKKATRKRKRESDGTEGPASWPGGNGSLADQDSDAKAQLSDATPRGVRTATDGFRRANTKRARRTATSATRSTIPEERAAAAGSGTKRKASDSVDPDDVGVEDDKSGGQTGRKRKKRKSRPGKPTDGTAR